MRCSFINSTSLLLNRFTLGHQSSPGSLLCQAKLLSFLLASSVWAHQTRTIIGSTTFWHSESGGLLFACVAFWLTHPPFWLQVFFSIFWNLSRFPLCWTMILPAAIWLFIYTHFTYIVADCTPLWSLFTSFPPLFMYVFHYHLLFKSLTFSHRYSRLLSIFQRGMQSYCR